ncbi:MAG TPA: cupin domain-containing protein [Thermoleophilaceae bacterium]
MAYIGQTLENRVTGEKLTFVETAASTDGERVVVDLELAVGGKVPGVHVHPKQEEKFEVLQGTMKFRYGVKKIVAQAGETVVVPAGKVHDFANAGDVPAHVRVTISPALKMEEMFEATVALAEEGKVMRSGMPKPLELALFVTEFGDEARAPFPPHFVVRAVMAPLGAIAKRRGRNCRYQPADCEPVLVGV